MHTSMSILLLASIPLGFQPSGTEGPYNPYRGDLFYYRTEIHGQVLDVFGGDQLLLSIGAGQGARKGLVGYILPANSDSRLIVGKVEIVEVGAKHSVVRVKYFDGLEKKPGRFLEKDSVALIWMVHPAQPGVRPAPMPKLPEGDFPFNRDYMRAGGAIIDLTTPSGAKLLPPRKQ